MKDLSFFKLACQYIANASHSCIDRVGVPGDPIPSGGRKPPTMCIVSALIDQALRRAYQLPVVGFEPPTQAMIPPQCYRCRFIQWPRQLYETLVWSHHPSMSEHVPGSSGATEPMPKARKKCPHGKQRFRCRECKGGGVCKHGKDKSRCKVCDGNAICRHGKRRARCIPCGGGDICIHKKMRGVCPTCNPSGYCAKLCRNRVYACLLYTSPSPRDQRGSRMPSSA